MLQLKRHRQLIALLVEHGLHAAPKELAAQLKVSTRTLRSDVARICRELKIYDAKIETAHGQGYVLRISPEQLKRLQEDLRKDPLIPLETIEDRTVWLTVVLLMSHGYVSKHALAEQIYVSTTTIASYIRHVRKCLTQHGLELKARHNLGYAVTGSETSIRSCLYELLAPSNGREALSFDGIRGRALDPDIVMNITSTLQTYYTSLDVHLDDLTLGLLSTDVAICYRRVKEGFTLEPDTFVSEPTDNFTELFSFLDRATGITLKTQDRLFAISRIARTAGFPFTSSSDRRYAQLITQRIIKNVKQSYHFDLEQDERLHKDLENHLCQMISSSRYAHNEQNPLLATIKKRYVLAYEIACTSIANALSDLPFVLSEDEIGYVALHIGAALERIEKEVASEPLHIAVLYGGKYAEGAFIASELSSRFKGKLQVDVIRPSNEAAQVDTLPVDLIVSTIVLHTPIVTPWVLVTIALDAASIERITEALISCQKQESILRSFFDTRVFLHLDTQDKDAVIESLCIAMQACGYVNDDFKASVFEREQRIPTSMDDVIALPHPMEANLTSNKVGIAVLEHPIAWSSDHTAQIIFLLGLSENTEATTVLYDTLVQIAYDHTLEQRLINASTFDEFINLMCEAHKT